MMGVEYPWLEEAFEVFDLKWGCFDNYVRQGLELSENDVMQLRSLLLE